MTAYGVINSPLKSFIRDYHGLYKEIRFSENQLDSLKADIQNNNITKEKIQEYIKDETNAVSTLKSRVMICVKYTRDNLKLYDSLTPKIIRVIEKLKKDHKPGDLKKTSAKDDDDDD